MGGDNRYQLPPEVPVIGIPTGSAVKEGWNILREKGYDGFEFFLRFERNTLAKPDLGVLYFLRGCLKTFRCDPTVLEDFLQAEELLPGRIQLVPDFMQCLGHSPALLRHIRPKPRSLFRHRVAVEKSGAVLERLTGNPLCRMICSVIVAEAFYLNGKIPQAIAVAAPVYSSANGSAFSLIRCYAGFVLVRCAIAMGDAAWFHQIFDSLVTMLKPTQQLRETSKRLLGWINAVTGYLGAAPRYTALPNGVEIPNIDARVASRREAGIGNRIAATAILDPADDNPPIELADVYTHIFHTMMFYKHCEPDEAVRRFAMADAITRENRIYMPFAEYGDQIVPLLRYAMKQGALSRLQMNRLIAAAQSYEKGLRAIREDATVCEQAGMPEGLFTKAEQAVLRLICEGKSNAEIAAVLGNRPNTVSELARRVFRKMRVDNRKEAIDKATHKKYFS